MEIFLKKLRLIFVPFLLIAFAIIAVYTFLDWLLLIKLQWISLKRNVVELWVPFTLPWIPLYIWVKPNLKLQDRKTNASRDPFSVLMIPAFSICIATCIAQMYLDTATGKLTKLGSIDQLQTNEKEQTKYYTLQNYYIDKSAYGFSNSFEVSGKYNTNFDMSIYVVFPVLNTRYTKQDTTENTLLKDKNVLIVVNGHPYVNTPLPDLTPEEIDNITVLKGPAATKLYGEAGRNGVLLIQTKKEFADKIRFSNEALPDTIRAWLGFRFFKTISNSLKQAEKEEAYKAFAEKCEKEMDTMDVQKFTYLERVEPSDDLDLYHEAIENFNKSNSTNAQLGRTVLLPVNEPFENRNGAKFPWIFGSLGIGSLVFMILLIFLKIDLTEEEKKDGASSVMDNLKEFFIFFKPREGYYVTPILIMINLGIFLLMMFKGMGILSFHSKDLIDWGANYGPLTTDGQWWRLLTNTFLHGGIMHIVANMYTLIFVGIFLEPVMGKWLYLGAYLLTGILASWTSVWWHDAVVSVGASGAIFGLYGVFLALMLTRIFHPEFSKVFLSSTLIFIAFNLIMGLTGSIDNAAHVGGLISGFVVGLLIYPIMKRKKEADENSDATAL